VARLGRGQPIAAVRSGPLVAPPATVATLADTAAGTDALFVARPKVETLADDFSTLDSAKWTYAGNASIVGNRLQLTVNSTPNTYEGALSVARYSLVASAAFIELPQAASATTGNDRVDTGFALLYDASNLLSWTKEGNSLYAIRRVGGTYTTVATLTYNATTHRWLKISEAGGTIEWWTSTDGETWTSRGTWTTSFPVDGVQVRLETGIWDVASGFTSALFDNFNVVAATPVTLTEVGMGTDAVAVAGTAPLAETSTGTDAVTVAARAPLTETPTGTDTVAVSVAVTLTDTATATDALAVSVPAAITDSATATDAVAVAARAPLAETATGTDALTITAKTIGLADNATGTDNLTTPARSIPLTENATGTDALTITAKTIGLADNATATDNLFLSAQTKQLTDSVTATDSFGLNGSANPVLTEIGTGTDALTVAVRVPIADTSTGTDAVTVKAGVSLTDQGSVTDAIAVSARGLPITDDATGTDALTVSASVSLNETATAADALTVSVTIAKILTDSATVTDALAVETQNFRNITVRFGTPRSRSLTVGEPRTRIFRPGLPMSRRLVLAGDPS
jgi:hypothetical protein